MKVLKKLREVKQKMTKVICEEKNCYNNHSGICINQEIVLKDYSLAFLTPRSTIVCTSAIIVKEKKTSLELNKKEVA